MYSGICGFEKGIEDAESEIESSNISNDKSRTPQHKGCSFHWECIGRSEIDKYAEAIARYHYPNIKNYGDATRIIPEELPDFDCIVGGFPCQSFSIAGKREAFSDIRGTLFFEICRIAKVKRPAYLWLENVKGLLSAPYTEVVQEWDETDFDDNGEPTPSAIKKYKGVPGTKGWVFLTILNTLWELGYDVQWQLLNSKYHGVPQNRERVFIIANRRDVPRLNIFPLRSLNDRYSSITERERVYLLPPEISQNYGVFFQSLSQSKERVLSKQQMQDLLTEVSKGLQEGSSREISQCPTQMGTDTEGCIQVVEELNTWASGIDNSREVCGVVQIPTEEVLLLWLKGGTTSISFRCIQQQDLSFECGQGRFVESIRRGESGSLLFAVQPYQGRLFYSIGNGRDWQNIYIAEVEDECRTTLSSILEENVDSKYFLSKISLQRIMKMQTEMKPLQIVSVLTTEKEQPGIMPEL
jgi:DNA-cytosine methyltransferase